MFYKYRATDRPWVSLLNGDVGGHQVAAALSDAGWLNDVKAPFPGDVNSGPPSVPESEMTSVGHSGDVATKCPRAVRRFEPTLSYTVIPKAIFKRISNLINFGNGPSPKVWFGNHLICSIDRIPDLRTIPDDSLFVVFASSGQLKAAISEGVEHTVSGGDQILALKSTLPGAIWQRVDLVICTGNLPRDLLIAAGCDDWKIHIIPFGREPQQMTVVRRGQEKSRFIFVEPEPSLMSLRCLFSAWRQVMPAHAELTLACCKLDQELAEEAERIGIAVDTRLSVDSLDPLLAMSDAVILPSSGMRPQNFASRH